MVVLVLMLKVVYFPEYIDVFDLRIRLEACCDLRLPSWNVCLVDTEGQIMRSNQVNLSLVRAIFPTLHHWGIQRPLKKYSCPRTSVQEIEHLVALSELDEEVVSLVFLELTSSMIPEMLLTREEIPPEETSPSVACMENIPVDGQLPIHMIHPCWE